MWVIYEKMNVSLSVCHDVSLVEDVMAIRLQFFSMVHQQGVCLTSWMYAHV